jgi:hypothetical protein
MRITQSALVVLGVVAIGMAMPALAQPPADAAKPASEAPATPAVPATASATTAAPSTSTPPANPTSAASAPSTATPTSATAQAPASPASAANSTPPKLSPDVVKRAKDLGLHPETVKGVTRYCKKDTPLGTHFTKKECYDEDVLPMMVDQIEYQKSLMRRGSSCGGGGGCATP